MTRALSVVADGAMPAIVTVLLLGLPGLALVAPPIAEAAPPRSVATSTAPPLTYHAFLSSNTSVPNVTAPAGSEFAVDFSVSATDLPAHAGAAIGVPPTLVLLPTSTGTLHLYLDAISVDVNGTAATIVPDGPALREGAETQFESNASASLTSDGLAVMASWPQGESGVVLQWRWVITAPDGTTQFGGWAAPQSLAPANLVELTGSPDHTLTIGTTYTLCLSGPTVGQTYAIRLGTSTPVAAYSLGQETIGSGAGGAICLNATFSGPATTPQPAVVHLWELGNVTFLVLAVDVELSDPSGGGPTAGTASVPLTEVLVAIGLAFVAVVIAVAVLYRRRARRPKTPGPSPSANGTSAPPEPFAPSPEPAPPPPGAT